MIFNLLFNLVALLLGSIFSHFPSVTTLPTINGYDIDAALVTGMGAFRTYTTAFWPIADMFAGFLVLMAYYGVKMIVKLFMGHRTPGLH